MKRTASAHWAGDLKGGAGSLTTASHTLNKTAYSFSARFEEEPNSRRDPVHFKLIPERPR